LTGLLTKPTVSKHWTNLGSWSKLQKFAWTEEVCCISVSFQ